MKKMIKKIAVGLSVLCCATALGSCSFFDKFLSSSSSSEYSSSIAEVPEIEELEMNLMSYNIRTIGDVGTYAWENRKENMAAYLNSQDSAVICMQEVTTMQFQYLSNAIEDKYTMIHYERQGPGSEGLAIAYDHTMYEVVEQRMFWLSETPDVMSLGWGASYYRICVNVLFKHNDTGAYLDVYNVHLDSEVEKARVEGIKLILAKAEGRNYPIYMAGDFNDVIGSDCYEEIASEMVDCQLVAEETDSGTTWHNWGAIADDKDQNIDFCFVSEDISPLTFKICRDKTADGLFYSDHYGIKTTVRMFVNEIK